MREYSQRHLEGFRLKRAMRGEGWRQGVRGEERGSKEITWEPREDAAKMAELYRSQRTWGKETEARGLERVRVGRPPVCQPG